MLAVELLCVSRRHLSHLEIRNLQAGLLDLGDDLPDVRVRIWLDHRERLLLDSLELASRVDISEVNDLELS